MKAPLNSKFPEFDLEAHRGGRGLMPENTIPAMLNALNLGVNTLEMDTHITKDGEVVVTHDDTLSPDFILQQNGDEITKGKNDVIFKMDYAELKKFDVGTKYYAKFPDQKKLKTHIPRLSDLIDSIQHQIEAKNLPQIFYNIETKSSEEGDGIFHPDPSSFVGLLMQVILNKKITPYVIIQSFDKRTLQVLNQKYPTIRTAYLISNQKSFEENLSDLGFKPFIYSPNYELVTQELVRKCHGQQIKIIPWTVNTLDEIEKLKALGVDGVITDYPNLLKK
jgi:glycerophosphoryl diester phosphodiesterase